MLPVVVCLVLAAAILAVYAQTFRYDYVAYDDGQFVYDNPMVAAGLSPAGVAWALTTSYAANWYPLTWLSYQVDCQLFGVNAGAEHAVNVALHAACALLLFLLLAAMTKRPWRSALVAGIFALHPLHVESVAWIAERKDVLSTLLALLTILFYLRYIRAPSPRRYIWVVIAFGLALMAKPMVVTLPFILLLLDYWPLHRFRWPLNWRTLRRPVWEKAPLVAMSATVSVVTYIVQKRNGAVADYIPWSARIANAAVSYLSYIGKAIWPVNLAAFYPRHPRAAAAVLMAAFALLGVTALAVARARRNPYILAGWLWYLGALVPVIGIVQAGWQSMADRYTYVPLVGLSIALVWTVADIVQPWPLVRRSVAACSVVVLAVFAAVASRQAAYWKDSHTLFQHALAVTTENYVMQDNMGIILGREGRSSEAMASFRAAIAMGPQYAEAYAHLGRELLKQGRVNDAASPLLRAVRLNPGLQEAQADVGILLAAQAKFDPARQHLEEAVRLRPADAESQSNLCSVLQYLGRPAEAVMHCLEALKVEPDSPAARLNLASALAGEGKRAEAVRELTTLLQEDPDYAQARAALDRLQKEPVH